jgi:hypothetical protein
MPADWRNGPCGVRGFFQVFRRNFCADLAPRELLLIVDGPKQEHNYA